MNRHATHAPRSSAWPITPTQAPQHAQIHAKQGVSTPRREHQTIKALARPSYAHHTSCGGKIVH